MLPLNNTQIGLQSARCFDRLQNGYQVTGGNAHGIEGLDDILNSHSLRNENQLILFFRGRGRSVRRNDRLSAGSDDYIAVLRRLRGGAVTFPSFATTFEPAAADADGANGRGCDTTVSSLI